MPIYEYRCTACGFQREYLQKMSDAPLTDCPECGKASYSKMVTAAGFQLKGSGWYATDFKHGAKPKSKSEDQAATKAEDQAATKAEDQAATKAEDKAATKTESQPAAKADDKPAPEAPAKKSGAAASTAAPGAGANPAS
jgi:putative FmdB family regulatory protein